MKGAVHILKIILWIILGILALLILVLLANVKILIGYRESFYWKLYVGVLRINPEWFEIFKREKGSHKGAKKKKKGKAQKSASKTPESQKKKSAEGKLSLVLDIAKKALEIAPRAFRVRLRRLKVTVGAEDAADVAINYGKICALTEGALAFLYGYKGILHGFSANRKKVNISADFLSVKTKTDIEIGISFFVWQLLLLAVRLGVAYITSSAKSESK